MVNCNYYLCEVNIREKMSFKDLPYLIDLLDDDTPEVRIEIISKFENYGINLEKDIFSRDLTLSPLQLGLLTPIFYSNRRRWILENWELALNFSDQYQKLESALTVLSYFHYGFFSEKDLPKYIQELTDDFLLKYPYGDEIDLSNFLFQEFGIKGAVKDYNNPFNSNLVYAIKEKQGLPITLSLIYMLAGYRLDFNIQGCNFPGHFLTRVKIENEIIFIDCFNGGKMILENEIRELLRDLPSAESIIYENYSAKIILMRVLNNLVNSYSLFEDNTNKEFFQELILRTK